MEQFDLIVIGSGAGLNVASDAFSNGMKVAIIDNGPIGGTCLNRGCIPTKILLYPADVVQTLRDAKKVGVTASDVKADFSLVMKRMHDLVDRDVDDMMKGISGAKGLSFFNSVGRFVGDKVIEVEGKSITAPLVLIAAGTRELFPNIPGLKEAGYLTSTTVLELKALPESIIMIGGGYIAAEFAHFFEAMGAKVTLLGRNKRLLPQEEPEISEELKERLSERMKVFTGYEVLEAGKEGGLKFVVAKDASTGKKYRFRASEIMVAAGRRSNADLFHPEASGIKTDDKGFILVDGFLRTNVEGVFAIGDAIGRNMFRHTANYESGVAWHNMNTKKEDEMEELEEFAVPHAVFTYPEVASVGLTEEAAVKDHLVLVGTAKYTDALRGYAIGDEGSFIKVILDARNRRILGAHAIGPHATALVQPLVYLMNAGKGTYMPIAKAQTIHPAMEEIMVRAFSGLRPGKGQEAQFGHHHHDGEGHGHSHDHQH